MSIIPALASLCAARRYTRPFQKQTIRANAVRQHGRFLLLTNAASAGIP
jgi:hypothetical protein